MKLKKYLLSMLVAVGFVSSSTLAAGCDNNFTRTGCDCNDISRFDEELDNRDYDVLHDWFNTKRTIPLEEKDSCLTISGDVRFEWRHLTERCRNLKLRGSRAIDANGLRRGKNDFDVEFNLKFDYVCDRSWAVVHVKYDNSAGIDDKECGGCFFDPHGMHGSGYCCDLCLKKAYMGYNIYCCDGTRVDFEVGRRNLYNVFDSRVQFLSRFDGILLRFSTNFDCFGEWYWNTAGFIVDYRVNHFAWVTETGLLNLFDWGFDVKYSFIDWENNGRNVCDRSYKFKYRISQLTAYYNFDPELICVPAKVYAAFLYNHSARKTNTLHNKRRPFAWYAGFTVGQVVCEGDWAIDVMYQYVQAQSVPDKDVSGIGRGNVRNECLSRHGRGNTNYKGWRLEGLYAITDNLSLDTVIEWSREIHSSPGGSHHFSEFRLEAIYAF